MTLYVELDPIIEESLGALRGGGSERFPLTDGRIVHILATPSDGTSTEMATGISVLPPGLRTPEHQHRAEEIALIRRGRGVISVDGRDYEVAEGSVVVVPPNVPHVTEAGSDGPMVVYWQYGPAGSEARWRKDDGSDG